MRKRLPFVGAVLLLLIALYFFWPSGQRAPVTMTRDLGPNSVFAQVLRPETAAADLARLRAAPLYQVELQYNYMTRSLSGTSQILYTNDTEVPVKELFLYTPAREWGVGAKPSEKFAISGMTMDGVRARVTQKAWYATVRLPQALAPGESTVLSFAFRAQVPATPAPANKRYDLRTNMGEYGHHPELADGLTAAIPVLHPDGAGLAKLTANGPLHNAPPALWDVAITMAGNWRVISNGVIIAEEAAAGEMKRTRFAATAPRATLYVSERLGVETREVNGVRVKANYPQATEAGGRDSLSEAAEALKSYEALLGPYPYRELELVPVAYGPGQTGDNPGGGLVLLNHGLYTNLEVRPPVRVEDPLLLRTLTKGFWDRRETLFHEVAHTWFGELSRADVVRAPLWPEGLAHATAVAGLERVYGASAAGLMRERAVVQFRLARRKGSADLPVGGPVPDQMKAMTVLSMATHKPALFYEEVRKLMGDERYFSALRQYLSDHRFTLTADRGPVAALIAAEPKVEPLYRRWLLEAHGDEDLGVFTKEQLFQLGLGN